MSVYRRADGIYVYDFQLRRVRFYGSTGCTNRRDAEAIERQCREAQKQILRTAKAQATGHLTVNAAFGRFWQEVGCHYRGTYGKTIDTALEWLTLALGAETLLRDIGGNRITEIIAKRRGEGVSNATVNRTVTEPLRAVLLRARKRWQQDLPEIDWRGFMLPEPRERVRELRDHEESKLIESIRPDYWPAIQFLLVSGLRKREMVNLHWSDIDWRARTVSVLGKGDKPATIPLTGAMRAILAPLRGQHETAVFTYVCKATRPAAPGRDAVIRGKRYPITYEGLSTAWRRTGAPKAGIRDFRLHDLRHTIATRLLRESGNLKLVQRLLRHEHITTTGKYAHADDADLRAALDRMETSSRRKRDQKSRIMSRKTGDENS